MVAAQRRTSPSLRCTQRHLLLRAAPSEDKITERLEEESVDASWSTRPWSRTELAAGGRIDLLARQQGDHVVAMAGQGVNVGHHPPVPQHHDPIGQPEHLVDVM